MSEGTSHRENDDKPGSDPEDKDSTAGTSAARAKEREREMEESGEENAA